MWSPKVQQKWHTYWQRLVAPAPQIIQKDQRQQASLLSGLSLALLLASFVVVIIWVRANPAFIAAPYISLSCILILVIVYIISRTQHYKVGTFLFIAMMFAIVIAVLITAPGPMSERMLVLNFLAILILLASMLLSIQATLLVTLISLSITAVFFFIPGVPFAITFSFLTFIGIMSGLLVLAATMRNRYIDHINESRNRYQALFNQSNDAVFILNLQGQHIQVNQSGANMLGYTRDELTGLSYRRLVASGEVADSEKMLQRLLSNNSLPIYERIFRKKDGTELPCEVNVELVKDAQGKPLHIQSIVRDISERKLMEQQLVRQERMAAVGQLAAGIAHDFNNILAGILLYADLLMQTPGTTEAVRSRLATISSEGQRAARLVSQILDFSQKTIRSPEPLDLIPFVKETIQLLEATLPENIQIELDVEATELLLEADSSQMQQLLTNLAVNARRAMPEGGKLHIGLSRNVCEAGKRCSVSGNLITGDWVQLQIADTGCGIPPNILPHIFEPFFTTREVGEGSGLGLSQVAGIVAQHGGYITAVSELGRGTTFTIFLPPLTADKMALNEPSVAKIKPGHGQTVLVVEDEQTVLEATTAVLKHLGYNVLTATTGTEATAVFTAHKQQIALVLSDMVMPDMDGEAIFHRLKAENPQLKMVIVSGYPLEEKGKKLLAQGLIAWLQKPTSLEQLAQVINKTLAEKKGRWI